MAAAIMSDGAAPEVQGRAGSRPGLQRPRARPVPLQRLPAARHHRHGAPRHSRAGARHRCSSACRRCCRRIAAEERGLVLVTGTTGSGKSTTLAAMVDYINNTRSAHIITIEDPIEYLHRDSSVDHQPARDRRRHAVVRLRAAQRAAPGPGRHSRRRNARHGDDRDRAARRRNRSPGVLDAAHARRDRNHQPHHLGLPAAPAETDPPAARGRAEGRHLAASGAERRRREPRARGRSARSPRPSSRTASSTRTRRI